MSDETRGALPPLTRAQKALAARVNVPAMQGLLTLRRALLTELRDAGWTLPQLASLMRTSKQHVAQLLARARDRA